MKPIQFLLPALVLMFSPVAFTQSAGDKAEKAASKPTQSEAQKSFDTIKTFAGEWEGRVTVPEMPEMTGGTPMHLSMRVTSRGNVVVHEFQEANTPLDASKYDHPVTMIYVEGDKLNLIHYCDAGNRPHMIAKTSSDGKTVEFGLVDVSGGMEHGHMHHALFTYIDADHHTEDWTYMMGEKPVHPHFDLKRVK
jgi:hypothetical protein